MQNYITPLTIEGSWVYTSYIAAAFQNLKAYPYKGEYKTWNVSEKDIDIGSIADKLLLVYPQNSNKYDSILIGPPNGGIVYLSICLNCLYLPSHLFLPIQISCSYDSMHDHIILGKKINKQLLQNNSNIESVMHFDPIHDRMDIGRILHNRIKFLSLPEKYKEFIKYNLKKGGTVINFQIDYNWPQLEIEDRLYMQLGGFGDIAPEEFTYGSGRVDKWLENQPTQHRGGWGRPEYPTLSKPESEWGSLPQFTDDLQEFCTTNRYNFIKIKFDHPFKLGVLASLLFLDNTINNNTKLDGIILETYWSMNPVFTLKTNFLPLWLPYVDNSSYNNCKNYLKYLSQFFHDHPSVWKIVFGYNWALPTLDIRTPEEWIDMLSLFVCKDNILTPGVADLKNPMTADIVRYIDITSSWINKYYAYGNRNYSIENLEKTCNVINASIENWLKND